MWVDASAVVSVWFGPDSNKPGKFKVDVQLAKGKYKTQWTLHYESDEDARAVAAEFATKVMETLEAFYKVDREDFNYNGEPE
jgi:hypothetical protein